ncbi:MAG: hypothetical protein QOK37_1122 [Thermoanaerobaculia bacterium]|nr:hypothetical protein [Thermoanaerobaculia bacterium]
MRALLMIALSLATFSALAQSPAQVTIGKPPSAPLAPVEPVTPPDPAADELARRTIGILGGEAWEKARFFSFTFAIERNGQVTASFPQLWDRASGFYRVSGNDPKGVPFVVVENVATKTGRAWQNGVEVRDPAALQELLSIGYRRFINDTFWLLMPLKMLDPGVGRVGLGERTDSCGHKWDVLKVIFDQGPGVPTDVYWAWINRDTGIVEEWDMKLLGTPADERAVEVFFHEFRRVGGLLISTRREVKGKNQIVHIDDLKVASEVPKGAFDVK